MLFTAAAPPCVADLPNKVLNFKVIFSEKAAFIYRVLCLSILTEFQIRKKPHSGLIDSALHNT